MPYILSTGTAQPPYTFQQADVKPFVRDMFSDVFADIDRLLTIFENTGIDTRHFCVPIDWFKEGHQFKEKNELYIENATALGGQALSNALKNAGLDMKDIHHLVFVSTTGVATPSIDALLFNQLGASPHTKRTPIWGLGCAGGAVGLSRTFDYALGHPEEIVALVAVELCGLTFQRNDITKSNLVATSLFADGAAAVIVGGDQYRSEGRLQIRTTRSMLWPDTLDVMGWDISSSGFHVIFSRDIPTIVKEKTVPDLLDFLQENKVQEPQHYIFHPGGRKVLEAYREALELPDGKLRVAEQVLRQNGNMSSCTVLHVLNQFFTEKIISPGEVGLVSALGPGFSAEMLLLEGI
ncbi:type III polyketide synthase [Ammoniphilus sp. CFH 90114]|uniref:type III polyketide synthase n=1 Tax=Ammoniphilus sp. CFH 90114 TaxID=2493665 RepID=UPI00100F4DB8|nr:3-oxoacyl-[acyl-carrier-protein] synthase III C-terminal domain-containing protein [Ammoniphilus sp. CFH 90114]RXT08135.1 type III polyketide synthase [Ammoniphilus sp. CFH 90114]